MSPLSHEIPWNFHISRIWVTFWTWTVLIVLLGCMVRRGCYKFSLRMGLLQLGAMKSTQAEPSPPTLAPDPKDFPRAGQARFNKGKTREKPPLRNGPQQGPKSQFLKEEKANDEKPQ